MNVLTYDHSLQLYKQNTENYIGTVKIPVGLIGPLKIVREENREMDAPPHPPNLHRKDYYVPLATTERAVIADYATGARATFLSGGVTAIVVQRLATHAPVSTCLARCYSCNLDVSGQVFCFDRVLDATRFVHWIYSSGFNQRLINILQPHQLHTRGIGESRISCTVAALYMNLPAVDIDVVQTHNNVHLKIDIGSCDVSESQDILINAGIYS